MNRIGTNRIGTNRAFQHNFRHIAPAVLAIAGLGGYATLGIQSARAQDAAGQNVAGQGTASQVTASQDAAPAGQRTDGQIEMDVVHALDAAPALTQDYITAGTVQGEVTLSGTSLSDANRKLAASIAGKVPGVIKVVNNLKVGDPQSASSDGSQPQDQGTQDYPSQDQASTYDNGSQPAQPAYPQPGAPRGAYAPQPGQPPMVRQTPEPPHDPVQLAQGTLIKVRSSEPLDSKKAKDGTPVEFTVVRDVYAAGVLAIPRGATVRGQVVDVKKSGAIAGHAELALKLNTLELGGKTYALDSDAFDVKSPNKAGRTASNAFGGALLGALIGGAVGGGSGAAIGAGAGAVGGTAASAATPGPRVWIPAEAVMDFHLSAPITVTPVSSQEAMRLATNAPPPSQRPTLYRRGYYPYGYPPPPPPPGYYYRPY